MKIFNYNYTELSEAGRTFMVRDPETGAETDIEVDIKGKDSKAFRKAQVTSTRQRIMAEEEEDEVDYDRISASVYAKCVIGWRNMLDSDGKEIPFSLENTLMLFEKLPWFLDQVGMEIENRPKFRNPSEIE